MRMVDIAYGIRKKSMPGNYVLSVTGGNYLIDSSGTSKVVKAHQDVFLRQHINFIVLFPISKTIGEGKPPKVVITGCYGLVVNGYYLGAVTVAEAMAALGAHFQEKHGCAGILIHHLYRSRVKMIQELVDAIREVPVVFYLHDYYSYCTNPKLMKNDEVFCGGNSSCFECIYGKGQAAHRNKVSELLASCAERLVCVAPSKHTQRIWSGLHEQYAGRVIVVPHLLPGGERYHPANYLQEAKEPVRIGFLGAQTNEKGWSAWKRIVSAARDKNYRFFYFGGSDGHIISSFRNRIQGADMQQSEFSFIIQHWDS